MFAVPPTYKKSPMTSMHSLIIGRNSRGTTYICRPLFKEYQATSFLNAENVLKTVIS